MRRYSKFIYPLVVLSVLSTASFANPNTQSIAKLHEEATQTAVLNKMGIDFQHQTSHTLSLPNNVTAKLKEINQQQLTQLQNLRTAASKLKLDDTTTLLAKLDRLIAEKKAGVTQTENDRTEMNFLNLRLIDGVAMINAVNTAAKNTLTVLIKMQELASEAANGTHSTSELAALNMRFQSYMNILPYVQSIGLLNGEKIVSGGDIKIQFGEDNSEATTLVYPVPSFDLASLNIQSLTITTNSNAQTALGALATAQNSVITALARTNEGVMDDALSAIAIIPSVLYQDFKLFDVSLELIVKACNGIYSSSDLWILNNYFTQLKLTLNKVQTYVSLYGAKMLGGGNIHIQIGDTAKENTTLVIELPVTDVAKLGLDKYTILSSNEAYDALGAMLTDMHDFAYGPAHNKG